MSLSNKSLLRRMAASIGKTIGLGGANTVKSDKLERRLGLDNLEDRLMLSVTADTTYDVPVNTTYSENQATSSTGNAVSVDDDGDFVVTWTRGDNIYYHSGNTITITENDETFTVLEGDVGLIRDDGTLVRLFTEEDMVKYGPKISVSLEETKLTGDTNEEIIWNFLYSKIKNTYGVAGLMGNLFAESGLNPINLENSYERSLGYSDASYTKAVDDGTYTNFIRDSAGYGLAQWTYWTRKQNMINFAKAAGKSIGDVGMQLEFLYKELSEGYSSVLRTLKNASSVLEASNSVLLGFERPADQSAAVQERRASYGQVYFDKYAATSGIADEEEEEKKEEEVDKTKLYLTPYTDPTTGDQLVDYNVYARYFTDEVQRLELDISEVFADAISMDNLEVAAAASQTITMDLSSTKNYINGLDIAVMFRGWFEVGTQKVYFDYVVNGDEATNSENIQIALSSALSKYYNTTINLTVTYNETSNKYDIRIGSNIASASEVKVTMQAGSVQTITVPEINSPGTRIIKVWYRWGMSNDDIVFDEASRSATVTFTSAPTKGDGNLRLTLSKNGKDLTDEIENVEIEYDTDLKAYVCTFNFINDKDPAGEYLYMVEQGTYDIRLTDSETALLEQGGLLTWQAEEYTFHQDTAAEDLQEKLEECFGKGNVKVTMPNGANEFLIVFSTTGTFSDIGLVEMEVSIQSVDIQTEMEVDDSAAQTTVNIVFPQDLENGVYNGMLTCTVGETTTDKPFFYMVADWEAEEATDLNIETLQDLFNSVLDPEDQEAVISVTKNIIEEQVVYTVTLDTRDITALEMILAGGDYETLTRVGKSANLNSFTLSTGGNCIQKLTFSSLNKFPATDPTSASTATGKAPIAAKCTFTYMIGGAKKTATCTFAEYSGGESTVMQAYRDAAVMQYALEEIFGEGKVTVKPLSSCEFQIEFEPTAAAGKDTLLQAQITASTSGTFPGVYVEWLRQPVVTAPIGLVYNLDGSINMGATAANIEDAFKTSLSLLEETVQGRTVNDTEENQIDNAIGFWDDQEKEQEDLVKLVDDDDFTEPDIVQQSLIEVKAVPVYNLGTGLIGFDLTFTGASGSINVPEVDVESITAVAKEEYYTRLQSKTIIFDTTNYKAVTTLKQSSEEFRVNSEEDDVYNWRTGVYHTTAQSTSSVALDADGDFVITWTSETTNAQIPGSYYDVYSRIFSASMYQTPDGTLLNDGNCFKAKSDQFMVNAHTTGPQYNSSVAVDNDGNFVVVWSSKEQTQSFFNAVYMQVYDNHGNRIGDQVRVDVEQTWEARNPVVAFSPDGKFIAVAWEWAPNTNPDDTVVYYRLYGYSTDAAGVVTFEELQGITALARGHAPAIAYNYSNQFAIVWEQNANANQEYDGTYNKEGKDKKEANRVYMTQLQWSTSTGDLTAGAMTVLRGTRLVSSATGSQYGSSVMLDADGDIVVAYNGKGTDATVNLNISTEVLQKMFADVINDKTNADLKTFFDPASATIIADDVYSDIDSQTTETISTWYSLDTTTIETTGDVDAVMIAILANAQKSGANTEQLGRLGAILEKRLGVLRGGSNDALFTVYDANNVQSDRIYNDSIANARRDGSNSAWIITKGTTVRIETVYGKTEDIALTGDADAVRERLTTAIRGLIGDTFGIGGEGDYIKYDDVVEVLEMNVDDLASKYSGSAWAFDANAYQIVFQGFYHDMAIGIFSDTENAVKAIAYGSEGTEQFASTLGIETNGSFTMAWSENTQSSAGDVSNQSIFFRNFTESEDAAGPRITDVFYADGTEIVNGAQLVDLNIDKTLNAMIVVFDEQMLTEDSGSSVDFAKCVTNTDNWVLMKDGEVVENAISAVNFGMNRSADADMQAQGMFLLGENKWEAVIVFNEGIDLEDGTYQIIALNGMSDNRGNALNRSGYSENGSASTYEFNVIVGSQASENLSENKVDDQVIAPAGTFAPNSVASDYEGDTVTVWTSGSDICVDLQYMKWSYVDGVREAVTNMNWKKSFLIETEAEAVEFASVAMSGDGDFVVTWSQNDGTEELPNWTVYAQMFDLAGNAKEVGKAKSTEPFMVCSVEETGSIYYQQRFSNVAMSVTGEFVITWQSYNQVSGASSWDIYAQIYDNAGNPVGLTGTGEEFVVNDTTRNSQLYASVAMDNTGNFVVTWTSFGQNGDAAYQSNVFAKRYTRTVTGTDVTYATPGEFLVNDAFTTGNQKWSNVGMDSNGDTVITWTSFGQDGVGTGYGYGSEGLNSVHAQRYDTTGVKVSTNFQVNTTSEDNQQLSKVSMDADGDFVIVWESYQGSTTSAAKSWSVYAQRYVNNTELAAGTGDYGVYGELGSEFSVYEDSTTGNQRAPSVALTGTGDFFVVWQSDQNEAAYKLKKSTEKKTWDIFRRATYLPTDDTGNVVVRVDGYLDALVFTNENMSFEANVMRVTLPSEETTGDAKWAVTVTKDGKDLMGEIYSTSIKYDSALGAYLCEITFTDDYIIKEGSYGVAITDSVLAISQTGTIYCSEKIPVSTVSIVEKHLNALDITFGEQLLADDSSYSVTNLNHWSLLRDGVDISDWILSVIPVGYDEVDTSYAGDLSQKDIYRIVLKDGYVMNSGTYTIGLQAVTDIFGNPLDGDADGEKGGVYQYTFTIDTSDVVEPQEEIVISDGAFIDISDVTDVSSALGFADTGIDSTWTVNGTATDYDGDTVTVWNDAEGNLWATLTYAKWELEGDRGMDAAHPHTYTFQITENVNARYASVAMAGDGIFMVTWSQNDYVGSDAEYEMDGNGDYVFKFGTNSEPVLKTDWNVYAQVFDLNGAAMGDAFLVNTTTESTQCYSSVASNLAGDFVVVWQSYDWNTTRGEYDWNVYAQTYSSSGKRIGMTSEVQKLGFVNNWLGTFTVSFQGQTTNELTFTGNAYSLTAMLQEELDALAEKLNTDKLTYTFTVSTGSLSELYVAIDVEGDDTARNVELMTATIVQTLSATEGGNVGFTTSTDGAGGEFMVNTSINLNQMFPSVAMDYEGNFVVTWTADNANETSKKAAYRTTDVFARVYAVVDATVTETTAATSLTSRSQLTQLGNDDSSAYVTTEKPGVGLVVCGDDSYGTGSLLWSGKHVLTAAHVVQDFLDDTGNLKSDMTVEFTATDGSKVTATVVKATKHSEWNTLTGSAGDLAILELDKDYSNLLETYNINRNTSAGVGQVFQRYGYGTYTTSENDFDHQKRVGSNKWEVTGAAYDDIASVMLMYDYDDGTTANDFFGEDTGLGQKETISTSGDSGGPCFVGSLIFAVTHANIDANANGVFGDAGDAGMDTSVAYYAAWIDSIVGSTGSSSVEGSSTGAAKGMIQHTAVTGEFLVNTEYQSGSQKWSSVAMDANGDFTVTWSSNSVDDARGKAITEHNVYAKQYNAVGTETRAAFRVNTTASQVPQISRIAADSDGDFTVVWSGLEKTETDTLSWNAYGQRYVNATKQAAAVPGTYGLNGEKDEEFKANETSIIATALDFDNDTKIDAYVYPSAGVAMTHTGDFVVAWQTGAEGEYEVHRRSYFKVNDDTGSVLVRTIGTLKGEAGAEDVEQVIINNGRVLDEPISNVVDFVFGEQVNEEIASAAANWRLYYNDAIVANAIQYIEKVGYENPSESYDSGYDEKIIYRVTFKAGAFDATGTYTITIAEALMDQFGNALDGDMDGAKGGNASVSFIITEATTTPPVEDDSTKTDDAIPDPYDTRVNTTTVGNQAQSVLAMDDNGNYVVVWVSPTEAGSVILGQKYDRYGNRVDGEFYISDFVNGTQTDPQIAMDSYGNFAVSWTVTAIDTNNDNEVSQAERLRQGVFVRVFDLYGSAITDSIMVGVEEDLQYQSPGTQFQSSVAMTDSGAQFVVTWTNIADSKTQIYAQRFTFLGKEVGEKFLVSDGNMNHVYAHSEVALDSTGNMVVVWQNSAASLSGQNIFARKFNVSNVAQSDQFVVNTVSYSTQEAPSISMNDIGQFVVAWQSGETNQTDIYFQCFDSDLKRIGVETCASSAQEVYASKTDYSDYVDYWQVCPSVALQRDSANGTSFRIVWTSYGQEYGWNNGADNTKSFGVFTIRYEDIVTLAKTTEVESRVNGYTPGLEDKADVAMDAYGNTAIVWLGPEAADGTSVGTTTDIFYRVYTTGKAVPFYVSPTVGRLNASTATTVLGKNFSLIDNGGGKVSTALTTTTIYGTAEIANQFAFTAVDGSMKIKLNGVNVSLPNATNGVIYNATSKDTVVITGQGGEEITVDGDAVTITGEGYSLTVNGGAKVLFKGTGEGTLAVTASEGDLLTANGANITLVSAARTLTISGCNDVMTMGAPGAIAYLVGTAALETLTASDGVTVLASTGYAVAVRNFDEVYTYGGEGDALVLDATTGKLVENGGVLTLTTATAAISAEGFASASVQTADLTATLTNDAAVLTGSGDLSVSAAAVTFGGYEFVGFADVTVNGSGTATLGDTAGDDVLVIDAVNDAVLSGDGYRIAVNGFEAINALSTAGADRVTLYDTTGADVFDVAEAGVAYGANEVQGFASVSIRSENGGADQLNLLGSVGADAITLKVGEVSAKLGLADYSAVGFAEVLVDGNGGKDTLTAYDSTGDDTFNLTPGEIEVKGQGFYFMASNISTIYAYGGSGGADTLNLSDSTNDGDSAMVRWQYARMTDVIGRTVVGTGFANIGVTSRYGADTVVVYDSKNDDTFQVGLNRMTLEGENFYNDVAGFRNVKLYAVFGGDDTAVYDSIYEDLFAGDYVTLTSDSAEVNLLSFEHYVEKAFEE